MDNKTIEKRLSSKHPRFIVGFEIKKGMMAHADNPKLLRVKHLYSIINKLAERDYPEDQSRPQYIIYYSRRHHAYAAKIEEYVNESVMTIQYSELMTKDEAIEEIRRMKMFEFYDVDCNPVNV